MICVWAASKELVAACLTGSFACLELCWDRIMRVKVVSCLFLQTSKKRDVHMVRIFLSIFIMDSLICKLTVSRAENTLILNCDFGLVFVIQNLTFFTLFSLFLRKFIITKRSSAILDMTTFSKHCTFLSSVRQTASRHCILLRMFNTNRLVIKKPNKLKTS